MHTERGLEPPTMHSQYHFHLFHLRINNLHRPHYSPRHLAAGMGAAGGVGHRAAAAVVQVARTTGMREWGVFRGQSPKCPTASASRRDGMAIARQFTAGKMGRNAFKSRRDGRGDCCPVVPTGLICVSHADPGSELPGYCQVSLRDAMTDQAPKSRPGRYWGQFPSSTPDIYPYYE